MSAIMVCSEDSSEKERGWTIIATKILCLSLIGVIHFQGRFWDIKLQMNCLTLSWIRSMHLNFQKVCNFLLQFRKKIKNSVDMTCRLWYYVYVAYDGNELNTVCGSGGTADALASGASGGNPVEVQILSTAPILYCNKDFSLCGCGGTADAPS